MLKLIYKLIVFSILTFMIYVTGIILVKEYKLGGLSIYKNISYKRGRYGHTFSRLQEARKTCNVDIVILGSSHAYRDFDTEFFKKNGITCFNLGSSAQTHIQTEYLIKQYLKKLNPKIVIYEVYPIIFELDGVESSTDIISNDINNSNSFIMALKMKNLKVFNTFIYSTYKNIYNPNYTERKNKGSDTYIDGGYVRRKISNNKNIGKKQNKYFKLRTDQIKSFHNNVEYITKTFNIPVIPIFAPIPSNIYTSYKDLRTFNIEMTEYQDYINYNGIVPLSDSLDFYDSNHLNQNGVVKFNTDLINYLKNNFSL